MGIWGRASLGEGTPKAEVLGTCKQARRMPVRLGQREWSGEWQEMKQEPRLLAFSG